MRDLVSTLGEASVLDALRATASSGLDQRHPVAPGDIVGLRNFSGVATLGLAAPFGRINAGMLRGAADAATGGGELRLTPWRALFVTGITASTPDIDGFIIDQADPRLRVAACVGMAGCACGTTSTHADAARLAPVARSGAGISLHVSGCAKGCAKATATPVTLVARDGRYDIVRNGRAGDTPSRYGLDLAGAAAALAAELELA
jgi:precorrin-3B synthase